MSRPIVPLVCAVAMACASTDTSAPPANTTIVYSLTEINGRRVPAVLGENPIGKMEILRELYRLEPDLRYSRVEDYRMTDASGVRTGTLTESGTYVRARDTISFTRTLSSGTFTTHGAIEAARLVVRFPAQGVTLVYDQTPP